MDIKPIRSDDDLTNAFIRLENIFQADEGTPEAEEMEILAPLIWSLWRKIVPNQM